MALLIAQQGGDEGLSVKDVAEAVALKETTARVHLTELNKLGVVDRRGGHGNYRYHFNPDALRALKDLTRRLETPNV